MKRWLLLLGGLFCAAFALIAWFALTPNPQTEPVVLTVCVDNLDAYKPWIDQYRQKNEHVRLEYLQIPSAMPGETERTTGLPRKEFLEQLRVQIMAGKGPDVYLLDSSILLMTDNLLFPDLNKSVRAGVFMRLDSLMQSGKQFKKAAYLPQVMAAGQADGKQYLLPLAYNVDGAFLSEEQLQSADLDPKWMSQSPEHFLEKSPQRFLAGYSYPTMFSTPLLDYDLAACDVRFQAFLDFLPLPKQLRHTFKEQTKAVNAYLSNQQSGAIASPDADVPFFSFHSFVSSFDIACKWAKNGNTGMQFIPMPNEVGSINGTVAGFAAIGANSKHPKEAFALIESLLTREAQIGYMGDKQIASQSATGGYLPVLQGCLEEFLNASLQQKNITSAQMPPTDTCFQSFLQIEQRLHRVSLPEGIMLNSITEEALQPYFNDTQSLDEALDVLDEKWNLYLQE